MPIVNQENPYFSEDDVKKFQKKSIKINYFHIVDMILLRYGYLQNFTGSVTRCTETYSKEDKEMKKEIMEHIRKSIACIYDDKSYDNLLQLCIDDSINNSI